MNCLHLNIRSVIFIVITVLFHGVKHSEMAVNHMELQKKDTAQKDMNMYNNFQLNTGTNDEDITLECPSNLNCQELQYPCITCDLNTSCIYGAEINTTCKIRTLVQCNGEREFQRSLICRYCYQTDPWEHSCTMKANCNSVATPRQHYRTNCSVRSDIICLGRRNFQKKILCNWTGGYRWTTALVLSITLGGFGADRFYLGHWQEGIGKLFSFGGLGVWTLIDVILISLHYLGPADGSLFL